MEGGGVFPHTPQTGRREGSRDNEDIRKASHPPRDIPCAIWKGETVTLGTEQHLQYHC